MFKRLLLLLLALPLAASAQSVLSAGAIELSINFVSSYVGTGTNPWLLGIRQNGALVEIAGSLSGSAERVILRANEQTQITVPGDPKFAPLGAPGASAWLLPDVPSTEVLAPGITTENRATQSGWRGEGVPADFLAAGVPSGTFLSNRITLALESFSGPGDFSLYRLSGFGDPIWYFRTDDGLSSADSRTFNSASHSDLNWAFSAPGDYYLGLRASGTLVGGATTGSEVTTFHFQVVPEPTAAALLFSVGLLAMGRSRQRRVASASVWRLALPSGARSGVAENFKLQTPNFKRQTSGLLRTRFSFLAAVTLACSGGKADGHGTHTDPNPPTTARPKPHTPPAFTLIDHGDVEGVSFALADGKWDLHLDDLLHGVQFAPDAAIVRVTDSALTQVPASASYSFLGAAGAPVWLLPQSADEAAALGIVALGHSAAAIAPGTFSGDIALQLSALTFTPEPGVTGAGHFALYSNDGLGVPTVWFDSRDGLSAADALTIAAGQHRHFNWAFSQPGLYQLTHKVSATRNAAPVTATETFTYRVRSAGAPLTLWGVGETLVVDAAPARVTALGLPAVAGAGRAAVRATLSGTGIKAANNSAILLRADGETTVLARTGGAAAGLEGSKLKTLGDPAVSSAGLVSFSAALVAGAGGVAAANDTALLAQYLPTGGGAAALGIAWREGLDATGATGFRFTRLNWFFPSGDGFILSARAINGRNSGNGVWRASFAGGVPVFTLLIMEGQPFLSDQALKKPSTIALPSTVPFAGGTARALAADGTVTLYVRFADGSREIVQFTVPAP